MIKILGNIPDKFIIACSGGPDSMSMVDFFHKGKKDFFICFVHHNTEASEKGMNIVKKWCDKNNKKVYIKHIEGDKKKRQSWEEYWREERYNFFSFFTSRELPIMTAHHLDDCVETWLFNMINGKDYILPYFNHNKNVIRPFLLNRKKELINWCNKNNLEYVQDLSNNDNSFLRNRIRNNIIPEIEKINPGIYKVVKKKILASNCSRSFNLAKI